MGKNQLRLLKFAMKYPGWHTYGGNRSTRDALNSLLDHELIETNEFHQFRLNIDYGFYSIQFKNENFLSTMGVENGLAPKE